MVAFHARRHQAPKRRDIDLKRSDPSVVAKHTELKNKFTADHPSALTRNQEDREERFLIARRSQQDDAFGKQIQEVPDSRKTKKRQPAESH